MNEEVKYTKLLGFLLKIYKHGFNPSMVVVDNHFPRKCRHMETLPRAKRVAQLFVPQFKISCAFHVTIIYMIEIIDNVRLWVMMFIKVQIPSSTRHVRTKWLRRNKSIIIKYICIMAKWFRRLCYQMMLWFTSFLVCQSWINHNSVMRNDTYFPSNSSHWRMLIFSTNHLWLNKFSWLGRST